MFAMKSRFWLVPCEALMWWRQQQRYVRTARHERRWLYQVHAVTEGTDAQAEVSVRLAHEGRSMTARGRSGYAGGLSQGVSRGAQQDRHEAPARRAGGSRELIAFGHLAPLAGEGQGSSIRER
jgi:LeuA allosteric (dimerisation) domain